MEIPRFLYLLSFDTGDANVPTKITPITRRVAKERRNFSGTAFPKHTAVFFEMPLKQRQMG
jgi:hypothetical protein